MAAPAHGVVDMMAVTQLPPEAVDGASKLEKLPTYDARDLVDGGAQAQLVLDGQVYFLRITRAGKLILTK